MTACHQLSTAASTVDIGASALYQQLPADSLLLDLFRSKELSLSKIDFLHGQESWCSGLMMGLLVSSGN